MNARSSAAVMLVLGALIALPAAAGPDTLTILHLNDTHSFLAPTGPRTPDLHGTFGGIARVATLLEKERLRDPNALFLHAGDFSIGDPVFAKYLGVPELRLLALLGLDAMAVGNHEFDLTSAMLGRVLDSAVVGVRLFPLLSSNLRLPDSTVAALARYIKPLACRTAGNVKVGFFALTTPEANLESRPAPAFLDTALAPVAAAMVDSLRAEGCRVIICLSHLGLAHDLQLARTVPGITLIVGGHDHATLFQPRSVVDKRGRTTWIVQAGSFYRYLGKLRLVVEGGRTRLMSYELIPVRRGIPEEPAVRKAVEEIVGGVEATYGPMYHQRVATAVAPISEEAGSLAAPGSHDTPMGNLVADALRAVTGTQIAMVPCGLTAQQFYRGPILPVDVFRAVGYGFNTENGLGYRLTTFRMTGTAICRGLEFGLSQFEQGDEYLIQVSGMKYTYDAGKAPFSRLKRVSVGGKPIDPSGWYTVTANEYVTMFLNTLGIPYSDGRVLGDTTQYHALLGYVTKCGTLTPLIEGRVVNESGAGVRDAGLRSRSRRNPQQP
ncbi:MAG TPA: 5'-nucleotidase C-terminal domain-containing protein [Bacteroidota bacterium]